MSKTVLIGGGSGLIGTRLSALLAERGDEVRWLSRTPGDDPYPSFHWDAERATIDSRALAGVTHVCNLAGAGIADGRWTNARKQLIIESRTQTTALLAEAIRTAGPSVEAFVSASAIGYYGNRGDQIVREDDPAGTGFLSESTVLWERAIGELAGETGVRTVALRTGIVLSTRGGALEKMLAPARLGVSGYFGSGRQWYSWIHLEDVCRIYLAALDDDRYAGPINAVSPSPVRNKHLAQVLAEAVSNPAVAAPVPSVGLKLAFGEMSHTILDSTRVSADFLGDGLGFSWQYPELQPALAHLIYNGA